MSFKAFIRSIFPPILYKFFSKVQELILKKQLLFPGYDMLFKKTLNDTKVYGEYGMGESTKFVNKNYPIKIISVDSSIEWVESTRLSLENSADCKLIHIDIGEIENWGRPINFKKRENFIKYAESLFLQEEVPDTVLVDGRFRVLCFLYSLTKINVGSKILFDDYNREIYHIVEEIIKPTDICGDMALFIKDKDSYPGCEDLMSKFIYVID
jgi:hypothetical protein